MAFQAPGPLPFRWKRGLSLLFLLGIVHHAAHAQGFNLISGRNHPELAWRVAETAHFRIIHPEHLAHVADQAASIAETSYRALSANLGVTPAGVIRIYLTDEDEITNGFAVGVGVGHTNIWVHQNDPGRWTGPEKWLRHVIAHELAHIFHFNAVRSNLGWLQFLLANPLPRFWTEGLAQYQSETWNAQRGDRWLRTAVLDERLSYNDGRSIWNGALLYAVGHSQVRYFADQYGDSTLASLLAHRSPRLLGLARVHDFGTAFRATIKKSYRSFYDDWRRHVNVYYNTLAGQVHSIDSLGVDPLPVPGQYVFDVRYSPDTTLAAVLALTSNQRPVRRLYVVDRATQKARIVAEGSIHSGIAWSADGRTLAFSRLSRGSHGSLLNDLFLVGADGRNTRRLTRSRRATSPSFSPDGREIAFAGSADGTANVFLFDLDTGKERQLTNFSGDVQLSDVRWSPLGDRIAFSRFDTDGTRDVAVVEVVSGEVAALTGGEQDDRDPAWRPDGRQLAYTSLRDNVPNTFVFDVSTGSHERVTHLSSGARVVDWLPDGSTDGPGDLILISNVTKERDRVFRIPAYMRAAVAPPAIPGPYASWTAHRPPHTIPAHIDQDARLVVRRRPYRSFRNLSHVVSIGVPYYDRRDDWGVIGLTTWMEPLGKHVVTAVGGLSVASPLDHSFFLAAYVNNQWHPTTTFSLYSFPGWTRIYGRGLLVEKFTGGEISSVWPLDVRPRPYTGTGLGIRLRYVDFEPVSTLDLGTGGAALAPAESGRQSDLQLTLVRRKQRPWRENAVHPLDGTGVRLRATGAARVLGTDRSFLRTEASGFAVLGDRFLPALQRIYVHGLVRAQEGRTAPQDYVGFSRYDDVRIDLPGLEAVLLGETERVRGHRRYVFGSRMAFGSIEYRIPVASSLETRLLGLVSLGATTVSLFADGGVVWTGSDVRGAVRMAGAGLELKNALKLLGFIEITHALGVAAPTSEIGTRDATEVYYRVRTPLPF